MAARWSGRSVAVTAAVLVLGSACGGKNDATTSGAASTAAATTQPSPTQQSTTPLSKAELTSALLTVKDLPAGYKITPGGGQDDPDSLTGDSSCRKISAIDIELQKGSRPNQTAYADTAFSTADELGGGDESLASFAAEAAAKKAFNEYVMAADSCHSLGLKVDATTTAKLTGRSLPLPTVGDESRAYRYVGTVQGTTFWMDAVSFRVGGTLALLTAGRLGGAPESGLLRQLATKAAAKLA